MTEQEVTAALAAAAKRMEPALAKLAAKAAADEALIASLRTQLRRAEANTLPALFLLLGEPWDFEVTDDEWPAIDGAIDRADEPTALLCPASCAVDGRPDLGRLFRLGEILRRDHRGVTFYLRAAREATPTAEAVEAAIMCRRVTT